MAKNTKGLSFFDHLNELRIRVIKSFLSFLICSLIFYNFINFFLFLLVKPVGHLIFTSPSEAFTARMNLTFLGGFFLSLPLILYQIWMFVALGLTPEEKKYIKIFGPLSLILFLLGSLFAYFVMIPFSLRFLLSFSSALFVPMITVDEYISFVGSFIFSFGIVFELPLILFFLAKIGIASPEFLRQKRKHAVVLILIVSAVLTPPDVLSQILMALPLIVLYEAGIVVTQLTYKTR